MAPFSYYAKKRGFDKGAIIHETMRFAPESNAGIAHTGMDTSPRRYIDRIRRYKRADIWTIDSFGCDDTCRGQDLIAADISHTEMVEWILESLNGDLEMFCTDAYRKWQINAISAMVRSANGLEVFDKRKLADDLRNSFAARLRLARHILENIVQSPRLAGMVNDSALDRLTNKATSAIQEYVRNDLMQIEV